MEAAKVASAHVGWRPGESGEELAGGSCWDKFVQRLGRERRTLSPLGGEMLMAILECGGNVTEGEEACGG